MVRKVVRRKKLHKMNQKLRIIFMAIAVLLVVGVKAQDKKNMFNPVNTSVTSQSIAPDARAAGMGDVGAATDPDVNSQYWNPAKYPFNISRATHRGSDNLSTIWTLHIWQDITALVTILLSVVRCAISRSER